VPQEEAATVAASDDRSRARARVPG
jgi:hypothetical protein